MTGTVDISAPYLPDLAGCHYSMSLTRLHEVLRPKSYLEVGTLHGDTLSLARCSSIAVDPGFDFNKPELIGPVVDKPALHLFRMPSDDFFASHDPERILGRKIDFAFLDGMHRCEFLLRDFMNTERSCKRNSVIALHDCIPVEIGMTARVPAGLPAITPHRTGWWTGDVWRTALLLKRVRSDLAITALDAQPTGLLLLSNLDPSSHILEVNYDAYVTMMLSWKLDQLGLKTLHEELNLESTAPFMSEEVLTAKFWL